MRVFLPGRFFCGFITGEAERCPTERINTAKSAIKSTQSKIWSCDFSVTPFAVMNFDKSVILAAKKNITSAIKAEKAATAFRQSGSETDLRLSLSSAILGSSLTSACGVVGAASAYPQQETISDTVIALGSPGGQQNAISFGEIKKYSLVKIDIEEEMSNVTFPTAYHTAPIKGGSSGGALISCELELVGVNYAGLDDEFGNGYAVPIQKVLEFLEEYVY